METSYVFQKKYVSYDCNKLELYKTMMNIEKYSKIRNSLFFRFLNTDTRNKHIKKGRFMNIVVVNAGLESGSMLKYSMPLNLLAFAF